MKSAVKLNRYGKDLFVERTRNREDLRDFPSRRFRQLDERPQCTFFTVETNVHLEQLSGYAVVSKTVETVPACPPNKQ